MQASKSAQYHRAMQNYLVSRRRVELRHFRVVRTRLKFDCEASLRAVDAWFRARRRLRTYFAQFRRLVSVDTPSANAEMAKSLADAAWSCAYYRRRVDEEFAALWSDVAELRRSVSLIVRATFAAWLHGWRADFFALAAVVTK